MRHFPIFASLEGKACLVVGAGEVGLRRVELLLRAGAAVTVLAPRISPALWPLAADGRIRIEQRPFAAADVETCWLVVAATDDPSVNAEVAAAAERAQRFCNVVDDGRRSSFIVPAIVDRDPVTITVSTGGASPVLARWLKGLVESIVPARIGALAGLLREWRARAKARLPDPRVRRAFLESLVDGAAAQHALAGRTAASHAAFERDLAAWTARQEADGPRGEAYIVGAGPGAVDLITLRGRQLLASADIVLYDRLVNPEILEFARRDAQLVCVGKSPDSPSVTQQDIDTRLVELVRAGLRVCRLKGGDPMIFGHVAEELTALASAGLPFQIVPGVSAIEGCAAYAGIPLTWRGVTQSVLITTGHTESGSLGALDGAAGTIAIYMAARRCRAVASALIERGLAGGTPVAIVEHGTLEHQSVTRTTLAALAVSERRVESPALLLVGEVAAHSSGLGWFFPATEQQRSAAEPGAARVS